MTDILIAFPNLLGYDRRDDNRPVIISNNGGRNSTKTFAFLQSYQKFMNQALFGAGFVQNSIELRRVPKFIECAAGHGLVAGWEA